MEQLDEILTIASSRIEPIYMKLPVANREAQFRERVYCYELYHQLRCLWPGDSIFRLNGEIDKNGHPVFQMIGGRRTIPDLLVHVPGTMEHNYAIIEVKSALADLRGIRKDLRTFMLFRHPDIHYTRAIYLFFGEPDHVDDVFAVAAEAEFAQLLRVEVWNHRTPWEAAGHVADVGQ